MNRTLGDCVRALCSRTNPICADRPISDRVEHSFERRCVRRCHRTRANFAWARVGETKIPSCILSALPSPAFDVPSSVSCHSCLPSIGRHMHARHSLLPLGIWVKPLSRRFPASRPCLCDRRAENGNSSLGIGS